MAEQTEPTKTSEFSGFLTPEMAEPYFEAARKSSVVQQLVRRVPLGIAGNSIPYTTAKPVATWVDEAGRKPTTSGGKGLKTIQPKKLACITVVSAEVVRANPGGYMEDIKADIGEAFAIAFDAATLHGTNSPFGANNFIAATSKTATLGSNGPEDGGAYADLNDALAQLVQGTPKHRLTGFAFDDSTEPIFNASVDTTGRPLFALDPHTDNAETVYQGRMLRRRTVMGDGIADEEIVGFGGDWTQAIWGTLGGISYDVSTQATVTIDGELTSLWEHNLMAVRAEAEYGWLVNDTDAFVKFDVAGEDPNPSP